MPSRGSAIARRGLRLLHSIFVGPFLLAKTVMKILKPFLIDHFFHGGTRQTGRFVLNWSIMD